MSIEIVAELSASHNGSLGRALLLIEAAKAAGANAVKFQAWAADTMCLDRSYTLASGPWEGRTLFDLYAEAHTPWDWYGDMIAHCREVSIGWFASVFDRESLAFLEQLGCPRYKVASFELVDLDLISAVADTGKPIILSTGMATPSEIQQAVHRAKRGPDNLTLLRCVSGYPADPSEANLSAIRLMAERFGVKSGLSDHTLGIAVPVAAAALGASMVEKHLTLSRADGGLDSGFSLEPQEFADMVSAVRIAEAATGDGTYPVSEASQAPLRRSLYVAKDVLAGDPVSPENVRTARPAKGLAPYWLPSLREMVFRKPVTVGTPLTMDLVTQRSTASG